jgi:class 3 adenylate cyclase
MKRKIAAIMAADIVGYSKLVAEDEEETLRRLASYRAVFEDFITRFSGRIFNTAGDAVLAEFSSSVEAVRCAIDVQESIRTRNLAYPFSRQMTFRIGITIGDVVERDGDLLGDGVNIAARLEGLAQPGGLCVSRTVHEQVANKLSVAFVDIGEQAVKNIPTPIHAYTLALGPDELRPAKPPPKNNKSKRAATIWPIAITAASIAVVAVMGLAYQLIMRIDTASGPSAPRAVAALEQRDRPRPTPTQRQSEPQALQAASTVPDRQQTAINSEHASAPDLKTPCVQIRVACEQAGFAQGAVRTGNGIQLDCVRPIMQGTPQPRSASKPLPQIDPQIVEACKARNPNFGDTPQQFSGPTQPSMFDRPAAPMRP